jgi:parallel beta-helix repeat protein
VNRLALVVALVLSGCGGSSNSLCSGVQSPCVSFGPAATEAAIQTGFAAAQSGTTLVFAAGTFKFTNELTVTTTGITIQGAGMDKTILDFSTQTAGSEGILSMSSGFTIRDITVENTKGNGIKVVGATNVSYQRTHVLWTDPDNTTHGPYAVYPVQCTNVLVEDSVIEGASDAGIYVGQSEQIVVRRNESKNNVAGIEIENSHFADVYSNNAHDNTGGILVFALPGLQIHDNHDVRVHDNMIVNNNTDNFAAVGDIVGIVPRGTGTFVMAAANVEVFGNTYQDNKTVNFAIINYGDSGSSWTDSQYYPFPTKIYVHDNMFMGGGDAPDASMMQPSIGGLLAISLPMFPGNRVGDLVWDGIVDSNRMGMSAGNPMDICIGSNGSATFQNLHFDNIDQNKGFVGADSNVTPYQCTLPSVAPVSFPGLMM